MGYYLPRIYLTYFDKREYFKMELPMTVEKKVYKPCEHVTFIAKRTSEADLLINIHSEFVKSNEGALNSVYSEERTRTIRKGEQLATIEYMIPCYFKDGVYFTSGTISYEIQGVRKYFFFLSDSFTVGR